MLVITRRARPPQCLSRLIALGEICLYSHHANRFTLGDLVDEDAGFGIQGGVVSFILRR